MKYMEKLTRLPQKWDGQPITWGEWGKTPFMCGNIGNGLYRNTSIECECGANVRSLSICGQTHTVTTLTDITTKKKHQLDKQIVLLSLTRCVSCLQTIVVDSNGVEWELDEEDHRQVGRHIKPDHPGTATPDQGQQLTLMLQSVGKK